MSRDRALAFLVLALGGLLPSGASHALRPFESTDADVVDVGVIEMEAGILYEEEDDNRLWEIPTVVLNIGILEETELVLEGVSAYEREGSRAGWDREFEDTAAFIKRVWARSPDDLWSFATETGVLFPVEGDDRGLDFEGLAILTRNAPWGSMHLNVGLEATRVRKGSGRDAIGIWGAVIEAPLTEALVLAGEVNGEKQEGEPSEARALVGLIWSCREDLEFDAAVTKGLTEDSPDIGLTFGFTYSFGKPWTDSN